MDWNFSNFVSHFDEKIAPLSDISSSLSSFYEAFLTRIDWNFSSFVSHFDEKIDPLSNSASAGVGHLNNKSFHAPSPLGNRYRKSFPLAAVASG